MSNREVGEELTLEPSRNDGDGDSRYGGVRGGGGQDLVGLPFCAAAAAGIPFSARGARCSRKRRWRRRAQ